MTKEQLLKARQTLLEMHGKIGFLLDYVEQARAGYTGHVTFTANQIQSLKDKYLNEKSELVTLYNQLP